MFKKVEEKINKMKEKITPTENWNLYKKLNEHPGIKNVTWEIKNSLDGFKGRQDPSEERINELEEKSIENIQSEAKI